MTGGWNPGVHVHGTWAHALAGCDCKRCRQLLDANPHGTPSRVRHGACRCALCLDAEALRARRRRGTADRLAVGCWCEARTFRLSSVEVFAGRTMSCGEPGCTDERKPAYA